MIINTLKNKAFWQLLAVASILSGCGSAPQTLKMDPPIPVILGHPRKAQQNLDQLTKQLTMKGVQIEQYGQHHTLVVPSTLLFVYGSANWSAGAPTLLSQLADYIDNYPAEDVYVNAYVNRHMVRYHVKDLANRLAQQVSQGLDSRLKNKNLILGQGFLASGKSKSSFGTSNSRSRIEIYFQNHQHETIT